MPCRCHCPARCRVDSNRDSSAPSVRSDSHGLANRLDTVTRQLVTHSIVLLISAPIFCDHPSTCSEFNFRTNLTYAAIRQLVLDPIYAPNSVVSTFVTISQLVLDPTLNFVIMHRLVLNPMFTFVAIHHPVLNPMFTLVATHYFAVPHH